MDKLDKNFVPTVQWMADKYSEMNDKLFKGALMECDFEVFTKGAGMEGGVLGWFCVEGKNIRVRRNNRRIFKQIGRDEAYVNKDNFVLLCKPKIKLNGNYHGTEHGFLATLVHEMCHYYTYMNGYAPVQAHGREFKEIGSLVSYRSNGLFTVQRLATAEQMGEMSLNADMREKRAKRLANKKASVTAVIRYLKGHVELTITSNSGVIQEIESTRGECDKIIVSNNAELIDFLFSKGYKRNFRTWKYWNIENEPWIDEVEKLAGEDSKPSEKEEKNKKEPKKIFRIKTNNGVFEYDAESYDSLLKALKERFPKISEENLKKIINNPANYRMEENKYNFKSIVESVLSEIEANDEPIEITPDMNLGIMSPMEEN
jgi:hypothetical protein